MDKKTVFSHVDHTLLKATATWEEVSALCREALENGMATVCIPPYFVRMAKAEYPSLPVCTVIGFPLGYNTTAVKAAEAEQALREGADEIDMVVNLGNVKAGRFDQVTEEIKKLKDIAGDKVLKVIVETCYLTEEEKIALCGCVTDGGADYIKTSTGFGTGGATLADIRLFQRHIGPGVKIKASGGIRTAEDMEAYLAEGVDRIGASAAIKAYADQD
ncbi:MAG: deoxyribose-phosphate aldolase [Clostridiales bacterium]|nr:deoxyribose-phosphate aldolase [Clostridiales bacterium]